jgi:membrane fusion protein
MHVQLFREEVLQTRASQFEGHIVLAQPVPMRVAAVVSVILTLLLITYLIVGKYTRTVRVPGRLVPAAGAINVVAPQFGTVTSRRVREGDLVLRGQVLYELSSERTGAFGGIDSRIDASLDRRRDLLQHERALQEEQLQQRGKDLRERHQMTLAEVIRLDQEIELQENRAGMSKRTVERYRTLREQGFVSEFQLTQYEKLEANDSSPRVRKSEIRRDTGFSSDRRGI